MAERGTPRGSPAPGSRERAAPRPASHLSLAWRFDGAPAFDVPGAGIAFIEDDALVVRDVETGRVMEPVTSALQRFERERWRIRVAHDLPVPVVAVGRVLVVARDDTGGGADALAGIDTSSGDVLWSRSFPRGLWVVPCDGAPWALIRPVISDWSDVRQRFIHPIVAIDPVSGATAWEYAGADDVVHARMGRELLFVRTSAHSQFGASVEPPSRVVALDPSTGRVRFERSELEDVRLWDVSDDHVVIASRSRITVLDVDSGRTLHDANMPVHGLALAPSVLLVRLPEKILALDLGSFRPKWERVDRVQSLVAAGDVLFVTGEHLTAVVDPRTGATELEYATRGVFAVPDAPGGAGFIASGAVFLRADRPDPPFAGTVEGTVTLDGRPVAGGRVAIGDLPAITDARGRFTRPIAVPGDYAVGVDDPPVLPPRRPCVSFGADPAWHSVAVSRGAPSPRLEISLFSQAEACPGMCSPRDCD